MAYKRDNSIDRFLNALTRIVGDRSNYNTVGMALGFHMYELDGKWTNAMGKIFFSFYP